VLCSASRRRDAVHMIAVRHRALHGRHSPRRARTRGPLWLCDPLSLMAHMALEVTLSDSLATSISSAGGQRAGAHWLPAHCGRCRECHVETDFIYTCSSCRRYAPICFACSVDIYCLQCGVPAEEDDVSWHELVDQYLEARHWDLQSHRRGHIHLGQGRWCHAFCFDMAVAETIASQTTLSPSCASSLSLVSNLSSPSSSSASSYPSSGRTVSCTASHSSASVTK